MSALPEPEVVSCYFDNGFSPRLAAMRLHWSRPPGPADCAWSLPGGVSLAGPPPESFGVRIQRWGEDAYAACVLWDDLRLQWSSLTRAQLLDSSLQSILSALRSDLSYYLEQPVQNDITVFLKAS